jgi:tripartite-type tricarboxylate transporter receptor subunit TctC
MNKRTCVLIVTVFFAAVNFAAYVCSSEASEYPNKPITIINPFSAGGGADLNLRTLQPYMEQVLGQKIVISYKEGAGGIMGMNYE